MKKITLTNSPFHALVDDTDAPAVMRYEWKRVNGYAATRLKDGSLLYLQRLILNTPKGMMTSFKNGDRLDARRANIRIATRSQAAHNSRDRRRKSNRGGRYRGVCRTPWGWVAHIHVEGKSYYLGYHATQEAAARVYDSAARKRLGEFARLNFPYGGQPEAGMG